MNKLQSTRQSGFVLVLTLLMLSVMVIMVTQLFNRGRTHLYFSKVMIEREQARQLALGGIQLAMSELAVQPEEDKDKKPEQPKQDPQLLLVKKVLPVLNRWQEFTLKQDLDGIEGTLQLCISSEDGKLDINELFDFSTKKFLNEGTPTSDSKKALATLLSAAKKFLNNKDLLEPFEKFLKQRQYKLHDVTELMNSEELQSVFKDKIFYEPSTSLKKEQRPVYLTDIFTIWSGQPTMNPWLLSDSIRTLLNLKKSEPDDSNAREKEIEQLLKEVKSVAGDLKTVWDTSLQTLYGQEFKALPTDVVPLLATKFHGTTFSVFSYGTIGKITQKVLAIIEAQEPMKFIIKKLYWL